MPVDAKHKIIVYLQRALRRDLRKGNPAPGLLSTADIAEHFFPLHTARQISRLLDELRNDALVDCYGKIEGLGNVNWWRLVLNDNDPRDEEEILKVAWPPLNHLIQNSTPQIELCAGCTKTVIT